MISSIYFSIITIIWTDAWSAHILSSARLKLIEDSLQISLAFWHLAKWTLPANNNNTNNNNTHNNIDIYCDANAGEVSCLAAPQNDRRRQSAASHQRERAEPQEPRTKSLENPQNDFVAPWVTLHIDPLLGRRPGQVGSPLPLLETRWHVNWQQVSCGLLATFAFDIL